MDSIVSGRLERLSQEAAFGDPRLSHLSTRFRAAEFMQYLSPD